MQETILQILNAINDPMGVMLVVVLAACGVWFTFRTRGVQFRLMGEMWRLLFDSGKDGDKQKQISSFEAFTVSLASRVGTGNLAGVATAIAMGGPGAVFWMWVMALIGASNAFVESTLAQLFKLRGKDSFIGGPAYYIEKGIGKRWFAVIFALCTIAVFGLLNNSVQSNTISGAFQEAFGVETWMTGIALTLLTLAIIFGGIHRIARVSSAIVPFMALIYIIITIYVLANCYDAIPQAFVLICKSAFGYQQVAGGTLGTVILFGFKRGLFSNEAGEGSAPNVAATANVTHPVKQGLIQTLGVFTDTLLMCTCTALIIMCSGLYDCGANGIELTQKAIDVSLHGWGSGIVAVLIFFFAFSSIIGNYYYGESNVAFLTSHPRAITLYRITLGVFVMGGAVLALPIVWGTTDIFMTIMATCNLIAIVLLGKYAIRCLNDYMAQRKAGKEPQYHRSTIPEIAHQTTCWPD